MHKNHYSSKYKFGVMSLCLISIVSVCLWHYSYTLTALDFWNFIMWKELQCIQSTQSTGVFCSALRCSCLDLHLSITNNSVSTKIYDKRDDFAFDIVNFPHLDGDVPRATSYGIYISQLIRFARGCSCVKDFNERNLTLTNKLLQQGYRFHKLRKTFSKFYYRNSELLDKYQTPLKKLLCDGLFIPPAQRSWKGGGYTGISLSVCLSDFFFVSRTPHSWNHAYQWNFQQW